MTVGSLVCSGTDEDIGCPGGCAGQAIQHPPNVSGPIVDILTGLRYSTESTALSSDILDGSFSNRNSTNTLDETPLEAPFSPMEGGAATAPEEIAAAGSAELPKPLADTAQDFSCVESSPLSVGSVDQSNTKGGRGAEEQLELETVATPRAKSLQLNTRPVDGTESTPSPRSEIKSVPRLLSPAWSNRSGSEPLSTRINRRSTISGLKPPDRAPGCNRCTQKCEEVLTLEAELSRVCRTLRARNDELTAREAQCELQQRLIADLETLLSPQMRGDSVDVGGEYVAIRKDESELPDPSLQAASTAAAKDLICAASMRIEQFDTVLTSLKYAANRLSTDIMERENAEKLLAVSREETQRVEEILHETREYACSLEDTISKHAKKLDIMSEEADITSTKLTMAERQVADLEASRAECAELQKLIQNASEEGQRMQQEIQQARATTRTRDEENRVLKARLVEALHREAQKTSQLEVIENKMRMGMFENQIPPDEIESLVAEVREWSAECSREQRDMPATEKGMQVSEEEYMQLKETVSALESEISQKNFKLREFGMELESVREYMKGVSEVFTSLNVAVPLPNGASSKRNSFGIGRRPSSASSDEGEMPWGSYASQ